jgi:hypothetical protein
LDKKFYHNQKKFPKKSQGGHGKKDIYKCPISENPFKKKGKKNEKPV